MILSQDGDILYWSRQAKSSTAEVDLLAVKITTFPQLKLKAILQEFPRWTFNISHDGGIGCSS